MSGGCRISTVLEGGPAFKEGLRLGDEVVEVGGVGCGELSCDEVAARIRGKVGSGVDVVVVVGSGSGNGNKGEKVRRLELRREALRIKSVSWKVLDRGVGYVRIRQFNTTTADDIRKGVESLQKQGVRRWLIDVRNNNGGYFPAGIDSARLFLEEDMDIVVIIDKNGVVDHVTNTSNGLLVLPVGSGSMKNDDDIMVVSRGDKRNKVVLLGNKTSASATEIFIGALKDNGKAVYVGENTFGKARIQTVSELSDGSAIAVTVARYETPKQGDINQVGIKPDVQVSCADDNEPLQCLPAGTF